ncbi:MAG: flotillin family protein [Labilithrix sp.]|nr:flotillin family protein [Labilithrix sp.]
MLLISVIVVVVLALAAVSAAAIVQRLIHICQPNEVLVFSGARRREGAREVGYRLVQGGRGLRIPLLETVDRLDLTNMIIDVRVEGAYSKGGIPLNVTAVANVKIASTEPVIGNAIERFLGKRRKVVEAVAKRALEGNLRGVSLRRSHPRGGQPRSREVRPEPAPQADMDPSSDPGLVLDTLKIQNVSDERWAGYLNSLQANGGSGQMRSRVAEPRTARCRS